MMNIIFTENNTLCRECKCFTTNGMAITVEPLDFENNCVEGRQARDHNYLEIERDTREE